MGCVRLLGVLHRGLLCAGVAALPEEDIFEGVGEARCQLEDMSELARAYSSSFSWPGSSVGSTGKICALVKTRGLYVSGKSKNRLLKDCEKSDLTIESENAVLQGLRKRRNA